MSSKERLAHVNQFDLIDAGRHLGIQHPLLAYAESPALAILLTMHAKLIARKRAQRQEQVDTKRLIAGDID